MHDAMFSREELRDEPLITERRSDGEVLLVTLNRPSRRNAFDADLMRRLKALWIDREALDGVRCVVITGTAPAFCTGADMTMLRSDRIKVGADAREELSFLPRHVVDVPIIAAVNGVCAGGGLHFVADADIAIASERATFVDPHVSVGQVTALEPVMLAPRARWDVVTRMALLGSHERLSAAAAQAGGLVSEVLPHDGLLPRAMELATMIASNSPAAVARSRRALIDYEDSLIGGVLNRGWDSIRAHWTHPDAKEGPTAFLEKRDPLWQEGSGREPDLSPTD